MQHGIKFSGLELPGKSWYKFRQLNASVRFVRQLDRLDARNSRQQLGSGGLVRPARQLQGCPKAGGPTHRTGTPVGSGLCKCTLHEFAAHQGVRSHLGYLKDQAVTVHNVLLFSRGPSRPNISPELQAELVAIRAMSSGSYKPEVQYFGDWSLVDHHAIDHCGGSPWCGRRTPIIPAAHGLADKAALAASKNGGKR